MLLPNSQAKNFTKPVWTIKEKEEEEEKTIESHYYVNSGMQSFQIFFNKRVSFEKSLINEGIP